MFDVATSSVCPKSPRWHEAGPSPDVSADAPTDVETSLADASYVDGDLSTCTKRLTLWPQKPPVLRVASSTSTTMPLGSTLASSMADFLRLRLKKNEAAVPVAAEECGRPWPLSARRASRARLQEFAMLSHRDKRMFGDFVATQEKTLPSREQGGKELRAHFTLRDILSPDAGALKPRVVNTKAPQRSSESGFRRNQSFRQTLPHLNLSSLRESCACNTDPTKPVATARADPAEAIVVGQTISHMNLSFLRDGYVCNTDPSKPIATAPADKAGAIVVGQTIPHLNLSFLGDGYDCDTETSKPTATARADKARAIVVGQTIPHLKRSLLREGYDRDTETSKVADKATVVLAGAVAEPSFASPLASQRSTPATSIASTPRSLPRRERPGSQAFVTAEFGHRCSRDLDLGTASRYMGSVAQATLPSLVRYSQRHSFPSRGRKASESLRDALPESARRRGLELPQLSARQGPLSLRQHTFAEEMQSVGCCGPENNSSLPVSRAHEGICGPHTTLLGHVRA